MSTLQRIREFALVAVLLTGALNASAPQADEGRPSDRPSVVGAIADLGHMTVLARRDAEVANLGSLIVSAPRLSDAGVADLGAMTVTSRRAADTKVADLGGITVTARRIGSAALAARPSVL